MVGIIKLPLHLNNVGKFYQHIGYIIHCCTTVARKLLSKEGYLNVTLRFMEGTWIQKTAV